MSARDEIWGSIAADGTDPDLLSAAVHVVLSNGSSRTATALRSAGEEPADAVRRLVAASDTDDTIRVREGG